MFWRLYKNRIKVLLCNKYLIFWSGVFPIILGTFFNMAFSKITEKSETLNTINVVLTVGEESETGAEEMVNLHQEFKEFAGTMEEQGYFKITYAAYDKAMKSVQDGDATGALVLSEDGASLDMSLVVKGSGMDETILKNIINTYKYGEAVIKDTLEKNPQNAATVIEELYSGQSYNKEVSLNAKNMDIYNQYYFALFAMTCMFGSNLGLLNTMHCQADQSAVGIRRAVSPTKKMKMVLSEYLAAVTIVEMIFVVLIVYLTAVLRVDLGNRYGMIALASVVSSLFGVALGYFLGVMVKGSSNKKESIQIAVVLLLNFFAGLMVGNMKFILEEMCPLFNRINPAAIISDCFYSICAYDDVSMYVRCLVSLVIWTVALSAASILKLRREKYANL